MLWHHSTVHGGDNFSLDFPPLRILYMFLESSPKSNQISTNPLIADGITLANLRHAANLNIPSRFVLHVWMNLRRCTPKSSHRRGQSDGSPSRPGCEGRRKGAQQLIYWNKLGMSSPRPTILCYFDSCHLKANKTAAVIRARRELSSFLLNNSRVLADLLQPSNASFSSAPKVSSTAFANMQRANPATSSASLPKLENSFLLLWKECRAS